MRVSWCVCVCVWVCVWVCGGRGPSPGQVNYKLAVLGWVDLQQTMGSLCVGKMQPPLEKRRPTHPGARKMPACTQLHHGPQRARNLPLPSNSRTAQASMPVPGGGIS